MALKIKDFKFSTRLEALVGHQSHHLSRWFWFMCTVWIVSPQATGRYQGLTVWRGKPPGSVFRTNTGRRRWKDLEKRWEDGDLGKRQERLRMQLTVKDKEWKDRGAREDIHEERRRQTREREKEIKYEEMSWCVSGIWWTLKKKKKKKEQRHEAGKAWGEDTLKMKLKHTWTKKCQHVQYTEE